MNNLINLYDEIKYYLSQKRYEHTLAVERECISLGELFVFERHEIDKLRIAALLHDITKEFDHKAQIELCGKYAIDYSYKSPSVLHAETGAEFAKEKYPQIVDNTIYTAIKYHATGTENMSLFEKIVYLADYIEETRKVKACVKLRKHFYDKIRHHDKFFALNEAMVLSFNYTLEYLTADNKIIDIETIKARNYIIANELEQCNK